MNADLREPSPPIDLLCGVARESCVAAHDGVPLRGRGHCLDVVESLGRACLHEVDDTLGALEAFYSGPIWHAHRGVANGMMIDSDNVLLLHVARPDSGFIADDRPRPAKGATEVSQALVVATICYFDNPVGSEVVELFERRVRPALEAADGRILASFVTETSPNNFPKLPVRLGEHVFVWFSAFRSQLDYESHLAHLAQSAAEALHRQLKTPPEVLRLQPTPRSQLTG